MSIGIPDPGRASGAFAALERTADLAAAVAAHHGAFTGPAQRRLGMSSKHWPIPDTYDAAIAELRATREELNDTLAEHENFGPLMRSACELNASMAREFAELLGDRERIRDERDELAVRVDELREENTRLRVAAGPTEVVLADGGAAVLG